VGALRQRAGGRRPRPGRRRLCRSRRRRCTPSRRPGSRSCSRRPRCTPSSPGTGRERRCRPCPRRPLPRCTRRSACRRFPSSQAAPERGLHAVVLCDGSQRWQVLAGLRARCRNGCRRWCSPSPAGTAGGAGEPGAAGGAVGGGRVGAGAGGVAHVQGAGVALVRAGIAGAAPRVRGQSGLAPSQLSAGSHGPLDARQTTVAGLGAGRGQAPRRTGPPERRRGRPGTAGRRSRSRRSRCRRRSPRPRRRRRPPRCPSTACNSPSRQVPAPHVAPLAVRVDAPGARAHLARGQGVPSQSVGRQAPRAQRVPAGRRAPRS
jgi:hypothetical protein